MKCSEAVEWMHRYIDHDLSEEESSVLFEHIQSCRDCEEEFAMLKKLSEELEQLPVLTPRYSLVDTILPQLEALDLARREEGSASEELPAATMTTAPVAQRRRKVTSSRSRAYRTGALGLAAAVILGVFIYQVEPRTMKDAEMTSYSVMDKSDSSLDSAAQDAGQPSEAEASSTTSDIVREAEALAPELEASDNKSASSQESSAGEGNFAADSNKLAEEAPRQLDSSTSTQKHAPSQKPASQADEKSAANNNEERASGDQRTGTSDEAVADLPLLQEGDAIFEEQTEMRDSGMMMGIAGFAALNEWSAPDGVFLVKYLEEHLYLYRNESDELTLVTDLPVEGDLVSGEWSEDGAVFTYTVEKDGASTSYTLHPVR